MIKVFTIIFACILIGMTVYAMCKSASDADDEIEKLINRDKK